jgi:homoserine O-acetyltransferase
MSVIYNKISNHGPQFAGTSGQGAAFRFRRSSYQAAPAEVQPGTKAAPLNAEQKVKNTMNPRVYHHKAPFELETGDVLPALEITYTLYGEDSGDAKPVLWIVHALTANSDPAEWWDGLVGEGKLFDPKDYLIVCANNLGSCYGTTGAASKIPGTRKLYGASFPFITIRDMTKAFELLRQHLQIETVDILIGGSMGGQVALEWAISQPHVFKTLIPIATNARHSAWGIAFNEAQRLALRGNEAGLQAARAIALLSYRGYDAYEQAQTDTIDKVDYFRASSYQQYQGEKLAKRFDKHAYYTLSKAMDSHNVGRDRGSVEKALAEIKARTLVIGISSDILFPLREQQFLQSHIQGAQLAVLDSHYGHDGFLIEYEQLAAALIKFLPRNSSEIKSE